ncbi:hypothetical protein [Flectobacillus roseus]|uniref:hypothetical protein n=1 Tax=Flectobacillus roseus TaxID=502259 RepID=UPI0024B6CA6C|nr:hypothetical protein [Flectobacillus roseus]MDI9872251.1 hypothetical protein [Flectobacillus roseus]
MDKSEYSENEKLKIEENPFGSFFNNNITICRDGESIPFYQVVDGLFCLRMESFLIIPLEAITKEKLISIGYKNLFE